MVLGSSIQMTMSGLMVTRNTGRRWVSTIHISHRTGLGRAALAPLSEHVPIRLGR